MKRLFFALDIDPDDKARIAHWRAAQAISAKPVKMENLHITLAFLGQVSSEVEQQLIYQLNKENQTRHKNTYQLTLASIGLFKKPQVLYLGFDHFPQRLVDLADDLKTLALSHHISQEPRGYLPHITIYRKAKLLPHSSTLNLQLNVNSFSLYHSESTPSGVQYHPLASWPTFL